MVWYVVTSPLLSLHTFRATLRFPDCQANVELTSTSSQRNPGCVTLTNALMDQYIMYCGDADSAVTLSYLNMITTGSTASPPATTANTAHISSTLPSSTATNTASVTDSTSLTTLISPSQTSEPVSSSHIESSSIIVLPTSHILEAPASSSPLPLGAIIGLAIGLFFLILLLLALCAAYIFRSYLARRFRKRWQPTYYTPRGTLGGATLPGPTWAHEEKETSGDDNTSSFGSPTSASCGLGILGQDSRRQSSLSTSPPRAVHWSPESITTANFPTSPELDGVEISRDGSHVTESLLAHDHSSTRATAVANGVLEAPAETVRGPLPRSLQAAPGMRTRGRNGIESEGQWIRPNSNSNSNSGKRSTLSATGSLKGYMSAETAMAGGWRDEGSEEDESLRQGH